MPVRLRLILCFFTTILIIASCVERFNPSLERYENLLVVDGYFTNEETSHVIKLFTTSDVYSSEFLPVLGADVTVICDDGSIIEFYENLVSLGEYSSDSTIKAEIGKKYKLSVLIGSNSYETNFQELTASPLIDTVYTEREVRQTWEIGEDLDGLQFYLDTKAEGEQTEFFQWKLIETFEYDAEFFIDSYYAGGIYEFPDEDSLFTCWRTTEISSIFTHTLQHSGKNEIKKYPLQYVSNDSKRLSKRYSLLVKQFSLNEESYFYWNAVKDQIDQQGSLYSKQPYQIKGNLRNIDNEEEVVLGFFVVAGVSEKRIFVEKPVGLEINTQSCMIDTDGMAFLTQTPQQQWPVYLSENSDGSIGIVQPGCVDCRLAGGKLNKPDFWK